MVQLRDRWGVCAGVCTLVLMFVVALSGCQAVSPREPIQSPTPILLPRGQATVQPTVTPEIVDALPTSPTSDATPVPVAPSPTLSPEATSSSVATESMIALGRRATVVLRARPAPGAEVIVQIPGSQVLRAQGRTSDGGWLWVTYDDTGQHAWVAAADVKLIGDIQSLIEIAPTPTETAAQSSSATPTALGTVSVQARTPAPAASPSGRIVFQTSVGGDIYVVNADGTGLRRLTDGMDPALSPDGMRLVFARWSAPHGLYVLDLRTGEERHVVSVNRPRSPVWSPDGSQIAFTHLVSTVTCLASPFGCMDEAALRALFGGQDCLETPFGRTCIQDYPVRTLERTGLARVNVDGQGWLDIPAATDVQTPTWRPGSAELLCRGADGLQMVAPGAAPRLLVRDAGVSSPAWSPDGTRVVAQVRLHNRTDIFLYDAAGNRLARLTAPPTSTASAAHNVAPVWSPDGKSLLFLSDRDGAWRLYRMNADGSGQAPFLPAALKDIRFSYEFAAERVVSWGR